MSIRNLVIALLLGAAPVGAQSISIPNTFVNGTAADADQVNANFTALSNNAVNRAAGVMTGVLQLADGAVGAPALAFSGETTTGLYRVASGSVGLALGGTQRLRLDATGLTVYGTTIIDTNGKIPALSSTYLTSVSGANLTGLTAANISGSHTLSDGVLSTNVPLLNAANAWSAREDLLTYTETKTVITPAASPAIDLSLGTHFTYSNTTTPTFSFTNPPASGKAGSFTLAITANGTAHAPTWPASVKWASGGAPTVTTTNTKTDFFTFITYDGGTTWFGFVAGQNF